ncbi:MAG: F-box protein [Verrucomicrobia bacterium]|nr:F-box protein [Verrucomicrobiota bacterium]
MAFNGDVTRSSLGSSPDVPLVVDRVEVLDQRMSALTLEEPDAIAELLAVPEKEAKGKKTEPLKNVHVYSISDLPGHILCHIFCYLDKDGAQCASLVCRDWNRLNTYPFGQLPVRIMHWGARMQSRLSAETFERTSFDCLHRRTKPPLLSRFSLDDYFSSRAPVSVSETFVRTDAIDRGIAHGKANVSAELKADPILKALLDDVFAAEKEHAVAYQPFYHSMNKTVYFFGYATKMLLHVMNQSLESSATPSPFSPIHWFRFPQMENSSFPQTIKDFLNMYPMPLAVKDGGDYDDHDKDIKQWIMAVSPFLFSNFSTVGESTWLMFLENQSVYPPDAGSYFNALCDHFHLLPNLSLREKYAQEFAMLLGQASCDASSFLRRSRPAEQREAFEFEKRGNRDFGFLFQIFVPKPLVDTIVYPCMEYGIPKQYRDRKMSDVFKQICADPTNVNHVPIQARMMTSPLVTRGNQIKVLTYGHNDFLQSPAGIQMSRKFEQFFLNVVLDSQI